jgi:hypothetical protein
MPARLFVHGEEARDLAPEESFDFLLAEALPDGRASALKL